MASKGLGRAACDGERKLYTMSRGAWPIDSPALLLRKIVPGASVANR